MEASELQTLLPPDFFLAKLMCIVSVKKRLMLLVFCCLFVWERLSARCGLSSVNTLRRRWWRSFSRPFRATFRAISRVSSSNQLTRETLWVPSIPLLHPLTLGWWGKGDRRHC